MPLFSNFCPAGFVYILVFALFVGFQRCEAADYCYINNGLKYCNYGCCSDECCGMSALAIVGLVIGAVLALAAIIGCVICLACMCKKSKENRQANMVHPIQNTNSVYVHNSGSHPPPRQAPPSYGQYGQYGSYPGSTNNYPGSTNTNYGFTDDAAYPPGAHPPPAYTYSDPRPNKF